MDARATWDALHAAGYEILVGPDAGEVYVRGKGGSPTGELREAATANRFALARAAKFRDRFKADGRYDAATLAHLVAAELRDESGSLMLGVDPAAVERWSVELRDAVARV